MVKDCTVLTIAGHDPSNGAGIGADLKVFEAWGLTGLSVITAVTAQNESEFFHPGWLAWERIEAQLSVLFRKYRPEYVKIGLVENAEVLGKIVRFVRKQVPSAFILWDPILKASAGFDFHSSASRKEFVDICAQLSLVTPNAKEAEWLGKMDTPTLVKGGHDSGELCIDVLLESGREVARFAMPRLDGVSKHGTGCVLSATILSLMAHGYWLPRACETGRQYLQLYLQSSAGLLGRVLDSLPPQWRTDAENRSPLQHRLYAITWDDAGRSHLEQVQLLCRAGVGLIQLRMKSGSMEERLHVAEHCLRICRQWGATLVINDDVELARQVLAPAIHLGLKDMSIPDARKILGNNVLIGGTANTPEQVLTRLREGADYVGLGPWRYTDTKQNLSPVLGADGVLAAISAAHQYQPSFPVFVIGGIKPCDCKEILELGARGVAVSSAIVSARDVAASVQEFSNALVGQGVRS